MSNQNSDTENNSDELVPQSRPRQQRSAERRGNSFFQRGGSRGRRRTFDEIDDTDEIPSTAESFSQFQYLQQPQQPLDQGPDQQQWGAQQQPSQTFVSNDQQEAQQQSHQVFTSGVQQPQQETQQQSPQNFSVNPQQEMQQVIQEIRASNTVYPHQLQRLYQCINPNTPQGRDALQLIQQVYQLSQQPQSQPQQPTQAPPQQAPPQQAPPQQAPPQQAPPQQSPPQQAPPQPESYSTFYQLPSSSQNAPSHTIPYSPEELSQDSQTEYFREQPFYYPPITENIPMFHPPPVLSNFGEIVQAINYLYGRCHILEQILECQIMITKHQHELILSNYNTIDYCMILSEQFRQDRIDYCSVVLSKQHEDSIGHNERLAAVHSKRLSEDDMLRRYYNHIEALHLQHEDLYFNTSQSNNSSQ